MGFSNLFTSLFKLLAINKELKKLEAESGNWEAEYAALCAGDSETWLALPDDTFVAAADQRLYDIAESRGIDALNPSQRAYYVVSNFDFDVCGELDHLLLAYLTGDNAAQASELGTALGTVGADEHQALWHRFLSDNSLDLSLILLEAEKKKIKQILRHCRAYSERKFDKAYEKLEDLAEITDRYLLEHRAQFIVEE